MLRGAPHCLQKACRRNLDISPFQIGEKVQAFFFFDCQLLQGRRAWGTVVGAARADTSNLSARSAPVQALALSPGAPSCRAPRKRTGLRRRLQRCACGWTRAQTTRARCCTRAARPAPGGPPWPCAPWPRCAAGASHALLAFNKRGMNIDCRLSPGCQVAARLRVQHGTWAGKLCDWSRSASSFHALEADANTPVMQGTAR